MQDDKYKIMVVSTTVSATVEETWRYRVPADWQIPALEEADVHTVLTGLPEAVLVDCREQVGDEENRSVIDIVEETYVPPTRFRVTNPGADAAFRRTAEKDGTLDEAFEMAVSMARTFACDVLIEAKDDGSDECVKVAEIKLGEGW